MGQALSTFIEGEEKTIGQAQSLNSKMKSLVDRMELLKLHGSDLTEIAKQGKLDPVIGRQQEINKVLQILSKKKKNNPCLVGDPGAGKTVIIEGLAQCLSDPTVPLKLQGKLVFALDMARVIAACSSNPGEHLNDIMTRIVEEVKESNGEIILFIDDIPALLTAVSSGEALDGANAMKLSLAKGEIKCVATATPGEYTKYIEKDSSLRGHFQAVNVPESTVDETIEILKGLSSKYEQYHGVKYEPGALVAAARLSMKYSSDCVLPGKAVDLIDEAGSRAKLHNQELVTENDMRQVVSMRTAKSFPRKMNERTVRISCKAGPNYSLTIRDGKVILAPSDPADEYQHWYKHVSSWAKDELGSPAFSLVNKASGEALEHSIGDNHPVGLIPFNPDYNGVSVLWTEGGNERDGYRAMSMINNIHLYVDALGAVPDCGGVQDGTTVVLWKWNGGDNQLWRIVPH